MRPLQLAAASAHLTLRRRKARRQRRSIELGELIATAYDKAGFYRTDPNDVSRLATEVVEYILRGVPAIASKSYP